jgi:cell division septum initiation protein DivIVA
MTEFVPAADYDALSAQVRELREEKERLRERLAYFAAQLTEKDTALATARDAKEAILGWLETMRADIDAGLAHHPRPKTHH